MLTLKGLPSVTPSDVCVVIGAKEGKSGDEASYKDNGLRAGDFSYARNNSYVYLLFGHIYSALRFSIKVDETYNALRTIKLKELRMKVLGEGSKAYGKTTVKVTLTANNNGTSPITSVDYSPTLITESASNPYDGEQIFKNDAGKELKASASEFLGHFVPAGMQRFTLVSVYDVYDKNKTATHPEGNLIRKDCMAENTMSLSNEAYRGNLYTVNLTVQPTYLYIMSDPDLDNPTIKQLE